VISSRENLSSPVPAVRFVRRARRLRAEFAGRPGRLHRALRELSETGAPVSAPPAPEDQFAALVAEALSEGVLRYSSRLLLIRRALAMGINRFQANLIIASVQHQWQARPAPRRAAAMRSAWRLPLVTPLTAVVLIEAAVVAAAWWLLAG
jgi:hypothetical protein